MNVTFQCLFPHEFVMFRGRDVRGTEARQRAIQGVCGAKRAKDAVFYKHVMRLSAYILLHIHEQSEVKVGIEIIFVVAYIDGIYLFHDRVDCRIAHI